MTAIRRSAITTERPKRRTRYVHLDAETQTSFVRETAREIKENYPWSDEDAVRATLAIHAASTALRNAGREVTEALGLGATTSRFSVLRVLSFSPGHRLTQKAISARLLIGWASVADLVSSLERDGLVTRTRNENDRRSIVVALTPQGESISARYVPAITRMAERFCAELNQEQKQHLVELLLAFCRAAPDDPAQLIEDP